MRFAPFAAAAGLMVAALSGTAPLPAQSSPPSSAGQPEPVTISVHADQPTGPYTPIWNFYGADEPNYIYAPNGKKLLSELAALSPVPVYFRPHNLLTTGNGDGSLKWGSTNVYTERPDGSPVYDFTITDRIFDTLVAAHVRPLVEIGFMPEALSTHPEPYRHTFPKGDVFTGWSYPPKDEAKWSKLVLAYATHLHDRYGAQVNDWLWEVWNEPDIAYWHGTPEQYDRLYDLTSAAIRQTLPHARIGGPEATGIHPGRSEAFLRQFLDHCAHGTNAATGGTGAPLDFISYHPKGNPKFLDGHVVMNVGWQLQAVANGMQIVAGDPEWKHTPIILGEFDPEGCAACQGSQNGYRNGPLYGVSVAEAIARTYELARKYGVTLEGAVTWAFEFEDQPAFAGFRELATDGIDKPVLNVFRMLGMLGGGPALREHPAQWLAVDSTAAIPLDQVVSQSVTAAPDINAIATRNGSEIDVLVWNYHDADAPSDPASIHLTLDGLHGVSALASEFRMDATHSNAYRAWQQMGSPAHPDATQLAALENAGRLDQSQPDHPLAVHAGHAGFELTLPRQAVVLLRIQEH
jgi:xylan 1,4-beta-xylosidase